MINNKAAHPRKEDRPWMCLCIVKEGGGVGIVELDTLFVTKSDAML